MGTARRTSTTMEALMVTPSEAKKRPKPRVMRGGGGGGASDADQPIKQNTLPHQQEGRNSSAESNRSQHQLQQHNQVCNWSRIQQSTTYYLHLHNKQALEMRFKLIYLLNYRTGRL